MAMLESKTEGAAAPVGLLRTAMALVAEEEDVICLLFWL